MDLDFLSAPFPLDAVHWRVQGQPYEREGKYSAMALAYLDARDVMDRLDEVCGKAGWQSHFEETPKGRVICRLSIFIDGQWVTKSDGAGDTDVEGEKGGISDALKRAAVSWGVGRYLYRLDSPWVPCEVTKKGDKVYWKKWAVDPWTKVRSAPPAAQSAEPAIPPFNAQAAAERIIKRINACQSLDELIGVWNEENATARQVADVDKEIARPIYDAKNKKRDTFPANPGIAA